MINHRRKERYVEEHNHSESSSVYSVSRKLQFPKRSTLSQEARETVLQIKKIRDPFDPELQGAFKEFVKHVEQMDEEDVDLPEASLLLSGATKIYSSQVDSLVKDVQDLLEHCTRTKKASFEKKKKIRVEDAEGDKGDTDNKDTLKLILDGNNIVPKEKMSAVVVLEQLIYDPVSDKYQVFEIPKPKVLPVPEDIAMEDVLPPSDSNPTQDVAMEEAKETLMEETPMVEETSLEESEAQQGSQEKEVIGEIVPKKRKNGLSIPPQLTSCIEELEKLTLEGFFDGREINHLLPPSLERAFRLNKRKLYDDELNVPFSLPKKAKEAKEKAPAVSQADDLETVEEPEPSFSFSQHFPSAAAASFSPEDQASIQECINELHYLPFTFGLSKKDLSTAFSKTVEKMSQIFKKNNVPVTRNMVKEASVIASKSDSGVAKAIVKKNGIHPVAHNLGDIYNTFVKMCRDECETFIHNSSMSIMERSKEKSFAESRANIRSMIAELQRNIVPKFARVALMAENTPEFFQHVTNFENKMKKILEAEAKKDEFDVRKYERNVLECTAKESSELERSSDDFLVPTSPLRPQSIDGEHVDQLFSSPSTRSSFDDGSHCSGSNGWVPLKHIFHHMKSFDRTETARSFYAVLALLSYQNLDINYDQLYSEESADLIKKQRRGASKRDDEMDSSKFPRGVKILTSRCPDADKEEVFVAALTTESRDEEFRHLLAKEARNLAIRDGAPCSSQDLKEDEGIAEALADFVEEDSQQIFMGTLTARRREKKSPQKPKPI